MSLSTMKQGIADVLNTVDGLSAYAYAPENANPPMAVVVPTPGGTYIEPGTTLGSRKAELTVRIYAWTATSNKNVTEALDILIEAVLAALDEAKYVTPGASSPVIDDVSYDTAYLTTDISITNLRMEE